MEKSAFLGELALILRNRGYTDDDIRHRLSKVSSLIDSLSEDERNAVMGGHPDVEAIADKLFLKDNHSGSERAKSTSKYGEREKRNTSHGHTEAKGVSQSQGRIEEKDVDADGFKISSDYKKTSQDKDKADGILGKNSAEIKRRDEEKLKALKHEAQKPRGSRNIHMTLAQRYESERNFWVVLFCCIPVLFFFAAGIACGFAIVFFALIALILLLVAALGIAVAAGSAVSLICIVYGLYQFVVEGGLSAVGLYEASMGIFVAGITMLVGVLIYNAAIRFVPWIMKKLRQFFIFIVRKLGLLADYLKGVCASI